MLGYVGWLAQKFWHADSFVAGDLASGFLLIVMFALPGTLLALRQPANPIGWLLTAGGLVWLSNVIVESLVTYALDGGRDVTVTTGVIAVYGEWCWPLGMLCSAGLPLLLFPAGHTRSRRWLWVLRVMVGTCLMTMVAGAMSTRPLTEFESLTSPWGIERFATLTAAVADLGSFLMVGTVLAAFVGILVRIRSASGIERQQLRWVGAGAGGAFASMFIFLFGSLVGPTVATIVFTVGCGFLPLTFTVAILRYRLYDLDRIVSRTVAYAAVTGLLVAAYLGLVTAVSRLTPSGSSLAVAASTLAVAALFQPLRSRVQRVVDRRFNRARYDAARTVDAFSRKLREQVDLDAVRADLLAVACQTMQPASATLWLRRHSGAAP
ncbi:MAG: hypothetical protein M4D85_00370 [Actinomycetota bacterium]|nr:hypothetical protein [Actinomycetota bacterium]